MSQQKDVSIAQEEKLAKLFNGTRTPRSGGGNWIKSDILANDWSVEAKTTVKPSLSYSVNKAVLDKMDHERVEMHKQYAALAFQLGETREDYFVISTKTMKSILATQEGIRELVSSLREQISELDRKYAELRSSDEGVSAEQTALYNAHKAEKLATIEELEKLV